MQEIKRILQATRGVRAYALWTPILVVAGAFMELLSPWLLSRMIDEGVTPGDLSQIYYYAILLVISTLVAVSFSVAAAITCAKAASGLAKNLRAQMYERIQEFSFANLDHFSPASLITRMTGDVTSVQNAFSMILRMAIRAPAMLIFAFTISFAISPTLAFVFLGIAPVVLIGMSLISRLAHPVFRKLFALHDRLNLVIQENVRGIRVVKTYVREPVEIAKFDEVSDGIYRTFSKAEKILTFTTPLMELTTYTAMILVCWLGSKEIVISQTLTTGELISLISYATHILFSLMMISMVMVMLTMSRTAISRIYEVLTTSSDLVSPENPRQCLENGAVEFDHVFFSYTGEMQKSVLEDISFHAQPGQTIGIIGGTGSGKTSLVQLIPRLFDVTSGRVLVGGHDVREYDLDALHRAVAMVLQKNVLFAGTIADNLRWGNPAATDDQLETVCRQAQIHDFIASLPDGYQTMVEQGGTNFSGGQKQRLCIARALLAQPKILILDDSTSAVDTRTENAIRQAWQQQLPETTVIVIAQRVLSVMNADQIIVLDGGKIADLGTHDQLMSRCKIYQEVYHSQIKENS